jgi:hypothetical protein
VSVKNQGGNDHAQDKVDLRIAPEKRKENRNGRGTSNGSKRDEPPFPYDPCKDNKFDQDGNGGYHKVDTQGGGHPFATLEPEKDGKDMSKERS